MKNLMKALLCAAAVLSMSACGSSQPQADQDSTVQSAKDNTTAMYNAVQKAFTDLGYTITKGGRSDDGYEFDAMDNNGSIEVSIDIFDTQEAARTEYDEETAGDVDDNLTQTSTFTNEAGTLSIYQSADQARADIETLSATDNMTISVDDVQKTALENVLKALASLGYQTA